MASIEEFAVLSDSYSDSDTFRFISETSKERYSQYKKAYHEWINNVEPGRFRDSLESVRQNAAILDAIHAQFPNDRVESVTESDEVYWSASPKEASGSDRSLVDCHYDAPLAVMPTGGVIYYRVIIAMNENNTVTTVFPHENKQVKMNTGDFHGLDYNKDWHCVEGSIPADKYRVLLKLHYLVIPHDTRQFWVNLVRYMNVGWTYLSRAIMSMSANPQNLFEAFVGLGVNSWRYIFNNIYVILIGIITILITMHVIKLTVLTVR
jgi:hypothetical protein